MTGGTWISYYRVSTERQGLSGLGLDAQRKAVADFLNGGNWQVLAEYTEIESGKRNDRPELAKAMQHAKASGATLLIAKLDRLSRDASFLLGLRDGGVEICACDMPEANRMMVGIMALVAEHEREAISARTKAALAAAKARGVKLGNSGKSMDALRAIGVGLPGWRAGAESAIRDADAHAARVRPIIEALRAEGIVSLSGMARELGVRGIKTMRGGQWTATAVRNLLARF